MTLRTIQEQLNAETHETQEAQRITKKKQDRQDRFRGRIRRIIKE